MGSSEDARIGPAFLFSLAGCDFKHISSDLAAPPSKQERPASRPPHRALYGPWPMPTQLSEQDRATPMRLP